MISVDEAWAILAQSTALTDVETCALDRAVGRILAAPLKAKRTQPPRDMSAMDGYAVRFQDIADGTDVFAVIGEAPAGGAFEGVIGSGQAVRIFTGGVVPDGGDHVIIQEDVARDGDTISLTDAQEVARNIRKAGQDFFSGDILLPAGHRITLNDIGLIANGNHAELQVLRRPRVALIASGDELVPPGSDVNDTQIPNSNSFALAALLESWGVEIAANLLIEDNEAVFTQAIKNLPPVDIIVPIGGASVGDYDYAKPVFYGLGFQPQFEKIAVKPGKPCWFAKSDTALVLGLPGNPSSAMVTAHLFLHPLIERLSGVTILPRWQQGVLTHDLAANGNRENYLRGQCHIDDNGVLGVSTATKQDSSLTSTYAAATCLVRQKPNAAAQSAGDIVTILPL